MKRKLITILILFLSIALTNAHEFWLQPKKFRYNVGQEMKVDFMVGESFTGELWDLVRHKVEKSEMHSLGVVRNLMKDIKSTKGNNLTYKFIKEGTHLVALESNAAFIELEGSKFSAYLKEDGMEDILESRKSNNQLDLPAREYYKRYAKLLVQCGARHDDTYRKRLGFRYEIVPLQNPYVLKSGDFLECRVMWEGRPSPHSLVKVWSHVGNRIFVQEIYAEDDGTIKFPISNSGPWMVSAVKMVASIKEGADYESSWASLVFGIE